MFRVRLLGARIPCTQQQQKATESPISPRDPVVTMRGNRLSATDGEACATVYPAREEE